MPKGELLRHGREAARLTTWHGRNRRVVIAPVARDGRPVSTEFVGWCCDLLRDRGISEIYSPALTTPEAESFLRAGFEPVDSLWFLVRPLDRSAPPVSRTRSPVRTTRARRKHLPAIEALDAASFNDFWSLDRTGILEARTATAGARFTVALAPEPLGYAITGWGSGQAYLQRLAVAPSARRQGIARDLVSDALRAARRRMSAQVLVNTQVGNEAALNLYLSLGFILQDGNLVVMRRGLAGDIRTAPQTRSMSTSKQ